MLSKQLSIAQIHKEISVLSEEQLCEVKNFVDSLPKPKEKKKGLANLEGIWAGKGFEKIPHLEDELKGIQKEITDALLKKEV
jgi:hypothetical protein